MAKTRHGAAAERMREAAIKAAADKIQLAKACAQQFARTHVIMLFGKDDE